MFNKDTELAKDLAQQSFVKLWIKRTAIPEQVPLKKYLFGIAKNHFVDQHRAMKRENRVLESLKTEALAQYHNQQSEHDTRREELLKRAIDDLPPKCREILLLCKVEGLAYKQVALKLNISVKTVESQIRIAYTKIRTSLKDTENTRN